MENKGLIYTAIKNRKVTIFMMIIILFFGIYSYYIVPKQEDPEVNVSVALITTVYPGASADVVEKIVTKKIEDELPEIPGYDYSESYSNNSVSIIVLRLSIDADVDESWQELREQLDEVQDELPEGVQDIDINTDLADTVGMMISLSGDHYSYDQLEAYAEDMKKDLMKIDGIARFDITGKQENEVKVEVDAKKLNYYNLSLQDITNTLRAQNIEIPSGAIKDGTTKINVSTPGMYASIDDIQNTIVAVSDKTGAVVKLKDIADVYMGLEDAVYKVKHNGQNAVILTGYFKQNKNIIITGKDVEEKLDQLKADLPKDIQIDEVLYQPKDVSQSIKGFMTNLLIGILIVVLVVFLSMGIRNAVIVSTAIPMSLLITFSVMYFLGIKVHQVSIAALIISLGMLVDNAIVISDAIQVRLDHGEDKISASVNGAKEVAIPVLTSTLTTVFAFVPLLILPGMAGEFIKSLPQIIIISLSASYIVAILVSPTMAYLFFQPSKGQEKDIWIRRFFDKLLNLGLQWKKATIALAILIFGSSLYIATLLGLQFFPMADKNILYINVTTENASNFSKTEVVTKDVEKILLKQKEITSYTTALGGGLPKFYYSMSPKAKSEDSSQIMLRLDLENGDRFENNGEFATYLQEQLDANIAGASAMVKELEQGEPIGAPIVIRITGERMEELKDVADYIKDSLNEIDGTMNVEDDVSHEIFEYKVDIDLDKASSMGITKYDIQREVNIALKGSSATVLRQSGEEYDILVTSDIQSKEELENLAVKSSITGNKALLKQVADIKIDSITPSLYKYDRELTVTVLSDVKAGYSSIDVQAQVEKKLEEYDLHDVSVVFDGEQTKIKQNFGGMGEAAIFIVFLIFTVLLIQFNSITQPFIIIITIPLSVIGSLVGLYVLNQPLSFTSLLGMVSLMGIVVNNAIVLVDYINGQRALGKSVDEACREATNKRFRPVMLTTLTTVIGLTPLAISGSNLFKPMAISIISGLLISSLLTLVIIPVVYSFIIGGIENLRSRKDSSLQDNNSSVNHSL